jgi:hypothetical protein
MILFVCIYYMMCNVSYVVCKYSILNGVIDSRGSEKGKSSGPITELRGCQSAKIKARHH